MVASTTVYQANLYPNPVSAEGAFGVCFSGGGSRALSCALGQLSALNSVPSPKTPGATLLNEVSFISSVSGGSWASVAYTFLPATISDSDFLIAPAAPSALTTESVSSMSPQCLGSVPQQFNVSTVTDFVEQLWKCGFFNPLDPNVRSWFWIAGVGELILKPFGLYSANYSSSSPYFLLDRTFSVAAEYISENITPDNPSLDPSRFYVCRPGRPTLIVNANMQESHTVVDPPQIPLQGTARATGIPGGSPDGTIAGGGLVESFAFASWLNGPGNPPKTAAVEAARCYSLCDLAGCSSAFFAEYLLRYVNDAIDDIVTELAARYHLSPLERGLVEAALETLVDSAAAELLPKYNYWPLSKVGQPAPQNSSYTFTDGGTFDNSGILGLLAQADVSSIVAFVNTETPLGKANGQITVDTSIPLLFGYAYPGNADPAISGEPYASLGGMSSLVPMSYVQVFDNLHGELETLCQGLYDASCGGPNRDEDLGSYPACFTQILTTVANPVANIKGGRQVTVLWVYSNRINNWQHEITDADIQTALLHGQSNQNHDGTLINRQGSGHGSLANFPHYDTVEQIYLAPEAVNMLAQLSAWTVQQAQAQIGSLLEVQAQ